MFLVENCDENDSGGIVQKLASVKQLRASRMMSFAVKLVVSDNSVLRTHLVSLEHVLWLVCLGD